MNIRELAAELVEALRPGCERIEIAGSIRRGKAQPKDIEIVAVPCIEELPDLDIFGNVASVMFYNRLHYRLKELYLSTAWWLDPLLPRDGEKYKRLRHTVANVCCDLFITQPETWGNIFAIRTGPGDFSQVLVARALRLGLKQDGGHLWKLHRDGTRTIIPCPEESDFFAALRVPYLEPHERSVDALRKVLA